MIPKNNREYAARLANIKASYARFLADRIRHWVGPEPTREQIAQLLESWARAHDESAIFATTVQGADSKYMISQLILRLER